MSDLVAGRSGRFAERGTIVLLLGLFWSSASAARPAEGRPTDPSNDDAFIESLSRESRDRIDRQRLARLLFGIASNLDGGKSSLRLLQAKISAPPPSRPTARTLVDSSFEAYVRILGQFHNSVTRLLDDVDSDARLWRGVTDGQRACLQLDRYSRLLETYRVPDVDLMNALSSVEACARLRTTAFAPRVEAIFSEALADTGTQRRRVRELEVEVAELEALLEDLRRLDLED
jgi:hypothetical protein